MTSRLTQDALESLFSQIRGLGRFNDHPSPSEVIGRLKHALLANKLPKISDKSNTCNSNESDQLDTCTYLTTRILESCLGENAIIEDTPAPESNEVNEIKEDENFLDNIFDDPIPNEWLEDLNSSGVELSVVENEALNYIAGYIAHRVRAKDPSLGTVSKYCENVCKTSKWTFLLSGGGLIIPTSTWMETIVKFETIFRNFHGCEFRKGRYVIENLFSLLERHFPEINKEAIKLYCRLRTFIRIRYLNREAKLFSHRKAEQKKIKWKNSNM